MVFVGGGRANVHQPQDDVRIAGDCLFGDVDHVFAKPVSGLMDARCIEEDELCVAVSANAKDLVAGGLGFVARDCDFLPEYLIQQSRLPDIGTSNYGDKSAAE